MKRKKPTKAKNSRKAGAAKKSSKKAAGKTASSKSAVKRGAVRKAKAAGKTASSKSAVKRGAVRKAKAAARAKSPPAALSVRGMGLKETAAAVFGRLAAGGHDPILSGQACAVIYGGGRIKAGTIEFAIREFAPGPVGRLLAELGFAPREARTFACDRSQFEVALVAAPLMIGDDSVSGTRTIKTSAGPLKLVTPTDCVRQRLSMFYRWGDRAALAEAVQVARRQAIDMEVVARWSEWEWATDRFQEFLQALKEARG